MREPELKTENEFFSELEALCTSPGYVHVIAYFCHRDNTIGFDDEMKVEDVLQQFSMERLVRTEISTLIGLAAKVEIDITLPSPQKLQEYIEKTESILLGIHHAMMAPTMESFTAQKMSVEDFNPFKSGSALREPIFYGGEGAYLFQYRDLSFKKYVNDDDWFQENKGYSIKQANDIVSAIANIQNEKVSNIIPNSIKLSPDEWTFLPAFCFSLQEVCDESNICADVVSSFLESFTFPEKDKNKSFITLGDYNATNAYPLIKIDNNEYILFQGYSLVEALYETPFFWFMADGSYKKQARKNRGEFTENFSAERLKQVFGENRVFTNIDIYKNKNNRVGEIDVLVVFGSRAIILQAKSKKLTIDSRKGNDNALQNDFKKAIQDAYNQAYSCAEFLNNAEYLLLDSNGYEVKIPRNYTEIYPFCVVSDHYPALSFQTRQFLDYTETDIVMPPFTMDVFFLDVATEILQSPLHFLSYVNRRVKYFDRINSGHELTILSYHLKQNLWIEDEYTMINLGDDICADLDLAMLTRRDNAPGIETPEGILTKFEETFFGKIIKDIDSREDPGIIELGFMLLTLGEDTVNQLNVGVNELLRLSKIDGKHHDITLGVSQGKTGLTIHCNTDSNKAASQRLRDHCLRRKYTERAETWFGLCIDPSRSDIRFGVSFNFEWEKSEEMDAITKGLPRPQVIKPGKDVNFKTKKRFADKIGRNEKCPCGSGKKYKKCCID